MYLAASGLEGSTLRQGDIVGDMHLLGALNPRAWVYHVKEGDKESRFGWTCNNSPEFGDVMVLSHSCEIDRQNTTKLTSIILAPLRNINSATHPDKVQELIDSNIIEPDSTASFLKYFFLSPNEVLQFPDGAIADFSKCFSIRQNYYDELLKRKKLQLEASIVEKMALKLALYFSRNAA